MNLTLDGILYLVSFSTVALLVNWLVWRYVDSAVRLPYAVFCVFYIVTSGIGGALAGVTNGEILNTLNWGLDIMILQNINTMSYWLILYGPLIVPGITLLLFQDFRVPEHAVDACLKNYRDGLDNSTLLMVFGVFAGYCFGKLAIQGQLGSIFMWSALKSDFLSMMVLRENLMLNLGSIFFGLAYITLPMLSFCALYRLVETRKATWLATFGLLAGTNVLLCMALMQKSPILLYMVFVGIGCVELKVVRWQALGGVAGALMIVLTTLQSFMLDDWDYFRSFNLITFRMAQTFPYYMSVYPDILDFAGIDLGLHLFGIGEAARDNFDVFNYMYPGITWVQGAAPGPSHLRAYAQGGILFAMVTLVLIGFCLKLIVAVRKSINGPASFAFYMSSLAFLYYLTQTSLRESVLSCYGIFWGVVGLIPLMLFNRPPAIPVEHRTGIPISTERISPAESLNSQPRKSLPRRKPHPLRQAS